MASQGTTQTCVKVKPGSSKTGVSLWDDLREVWPGAGALLPATMLAVVLVTYSSLPAFRVNNGSRDSCDPVRTYGEITEEGMMTLLGFAGGGGGGGSFLDLGSGKGRFPLWARAIGGFDKTAGVELRWDHHQYALEALGESGLKDVSLVHGDILEHLELLNDARVIYWNNLCFPPKVGAAVAAHFVQHAPRGARLYALAALPPTTGLQQRRLNISLPMDWEGNEEYYPIEYSHGSDAQSLATGG